MTSPKICECKNLMKAIICINNPRASEWYCELCRKSSLMDKPGEHSYWEAVIKGSGR